MEIKINKIRDQIVTTNNESKSQNKAYVRGLAGGAFSIRPTPGNERESTINEGGSCNGNLQKAQAEPNISRHG